MLPSMPLRLLQENCLIMVYRRFLAVAVAVGIAAAATTVDAGGSWGGSSGGSGGSSGWSGGSSGGSQGGGLFSRMKARWGSHGGSSSHGSSGGSSGGVSGGSSGGSSGGQTVHHASHGGSSGGSSGGGHRRVGPLKRLIAKLHARRAHKGSHGGSGGGSHGSSGGGSHGSSGGGSHGSGGGGSHGSQGGGSHGSQGGSAGYAATHAAPVHHAATVDHGAVHSVSLGSGGYESTVVQSSYNHYTPVGDTVIQHGHTPGAISDGAISDAVPLEGSSLEGGALGTDTVSGETILDSAQYESAKPVIENDSAMLTVRVPDDAVVTVNGHPTSSDGSVRQFKSRGLKEGFVYTYVVKATFSVDGESFVQSKSVKMRPGSDEQIEFEAPEPAPQPAAQEDVVTTVRLHVPASAQVTLAGNPTNGTGPLRSFRTKQLKPGQQWTNYTIHVTSVVNGQPVSLERTIDVDAGSSHELTFDFNARSVAVR